MPAKTERGRLAASPSGFRSFEINVKNVVSIFKRLTADRAHFIVEPINCLPDT